MASGRIVKRSRKSWTVIVDLGRDPVTGKRIQHVKAIPGRKENAEAYLRKVLNDRDEGVLPSTGTVTLAEYLRNWLRDVAESNYSPAGAIHARLVVERRVIPLLGGVLLRELQTSHFKAWLRKVKEDGQADGRPLASGTIKRMYTVLHAALQDAVDERLLRVHPMRGMGAPKVEQTAVRVLDGESARQVFDAAGRHHYGIIIRLGLLTGMRRSELLGLRWENVRIREDGSGIITVVEGAQLIPKRGWVFGQPKTARSRRAIAVSTTSTGLLRDWRSQAAAAGGSESSLVFSTRNGTPVAPSTLRRTWGRVLREAKLDSERRGFHVLRHTCASLMFAAGVNPKVVSERLGHATVAFTMQIYGHLLPTMQETAAQTLEAIVNPDGLLHAQFPAAAGEDLIALQVGVEARRPSSMATEARDPATPD
jgi:integrase